MMRRRIHTLHCAFNRVYIHLIHFKCTNMYPYTRQQDLHHHLAKPTLKNAFGRNAEREFRDLVQNQRENKSFLCRMEENSLGVAHCMKRNDNHEIYACSVPEKEDGGSEEKPRQQQHRVHCTTLPLVTGGQEKETDCLC